MGEDFEVEVTCRACVRLGSLPSADIADAEYVLFSEHLEDRRHSISERTWREMEGKEENMVRSF